MEISRRGCIRAGLAGVVTASAGGCARLANHFAEHHTDATLPSGKVEATTRLVNRLTFGPRPGDVSAAERIGREAFVDRLIAGSEAEDYRLQFLLGRLDVFQMDAYETQDLPENEVIRQLQQSAILRATYGSNQLKERMVDFWTNHFNIYSRKGLAAYRKPAEETKVIRDHALGAFPDLLRASAHSPAMLVFLDNQGNVAGKPNENYAREIMELHTMGVKSGYTQKDVEEVARCFTGWTLERRFLHHRWSFRFDDERHDNGAKRVLGHTIPPGGGERDAEIVLGLLSSHPATAHFISKKLCSYFLGDLGEKWVAKTERAYLSSNGDLPTILRPILMSPELIESPPILKRPFDTMISALRALDAETDGGPGLQEHLVRMGEPLYQWPMPDGYPTRTAAWTGTMLPRWNFAYALSAGLISGTSVDWDRLEPGLDPEKLFELTHARRPEPSDSALLAAVRSELTASKDSVNPAFLCLAAPSFQWR